MPGICTTSRTRSGGGDALQPSGSDPGRVKPAQGEVQLLVGSREVASPLEELGVPDVAAAQALRRAQRVEKAPRFQELGVDAGIVAAIGGDAAEPHMTIGEASLFG